MKKISRLPVWWQLFIGLACCFLFSLIVICASFFIDVKEAEKNNWFYLHKMNSQWEMEIETITKNLDYLKYLPLIDKTIMTDLRNDYEKQSLKKQLSYKEYVNSTLEDISGINPFILRTTILTENGNVYGNFVEDSLTQIKQAKKHIAYSRVGYKNEEYVTDVYEGEINMLPYKLLTIAYAMYSVESDQKLATIYIDLDFEEIEKCQANGDWDRSAEILSDAAQSLEKAGADYIVICTNTMHKVADEIERHIHIPLLHIAEMTAVELEKSGITKVGLLGTKYTMQQDFYKCILENRGIHVVIPNEDQVELVNDIIYNELCLGVISNESKQQYLDIIGDLVKSGVQGVILGCTEIGLLVKQDDTDIPLFDTTLIHAKNAALISIDGA